MTSFVTLCVPFEKKTDASKAGARWNPDEKAWQINADLLTGTNYEIIRPFVPLMHRPDRNPPYIRPMMVPQTSWGKNLRAVLSKDNWDFVRKTTYQMSGHRCRICGGKGDKWPVEADELWTYDENSGIQKLVNVISMCPPCHLVHHFGQATITGRSEIALEQMIWVNGWVYTQAQEAGEAGFLEWEQRSSRSWIIDYSWAERRFNITIDKNAEKLADDANKALIAKAYQRSSSTDDILQHMFEGH